MSQALEQFATAFFNVAFRRAKTDADCIAGTPADLAFEHAHARQLELAIHSAFRERFNRAHTNAARRKINHLAVEAAFGGKDYA